MKKIFLIVIGNISVLLMILGAIKLDILINPWINEAATSWRWYDYIATPKHALAVTYLQGGWSWAITATLLSFFVAIVVTSLVIETD